MIVRIHPNIIIWIVIRQILAVDSQVYDCRFWREPKHEIATQIVKHKIDKQGSVFYFWNGSTRECEPCRTCPEKTLSECTYVEDTKCITQQDWLLKTGFRQSKNFYLDQFENKLRGEKKEDEGIVVYEDLAPAPKQPDVYGKRVYLLDESVEEKF